VAVVDWIILVQNKAQYQAVLLKVMTFRLYCNAQFLGHLSDHQRLKNNPVSVNNYLGRAHDLYIHAADMNSSFLFSLFTSAQ